METLETLTLLKTNKKVLEEFAVADLEDGETESEDKSDSSDEYMDESDGEPSVGEDMVI